MNIAIFFAIYFINRIITIINIRESIIINFIINIFNTITIKTNFSININYYFILFLFFIEIVNCALNIIIIKLSAFNYTLIINLFF